LKISVVLEYGIKEIIEAELSSGLGAQPYERTEERMTYRNGIRNRKTVLSTGLGPVEIGIPKLREGQFYPSVLEQYKRVDRALISHQMTPTLITRGGLGEMISNLSFPHQF